MLVLTLADFRATRDMGPALAAGIAVMVAAGLTLLPALLSTLGPRAFHATGDRPSGTGPVWDRIAGLLRARPGAVTAVVLAVLAVGALGTLDGRGTLDFTEGFRDPPESVLGTDVVRDQFGPGRAAPAQLVVDTTRLPAVSQALDASDDVRTVTPVSYSTDEQLTLVDLELAPDPFSQAGADAIPRLRDAARAAAGGGTALIGGLTAETLDSAEAQRADAALIAPLTLVLVLLIVIALVRAVVAPLYLVGTVVLSYAFALGASSLVFTHLLGQPDSDPGLPLFAFIFLVALGVDYNIFLISRIREELPGQAPRPRSGGPAADRRGHHERRADPGRHLRGADGAAGGEPLPGRLHDRPRRTRRHVPDPRLPRAGPRAAAGRPQLVAGRVPAAQPTPLCLLRTARRSPLTVAVPLDSFWLVGGGTRCRRVVRR